MSSQLEAARSEKTRAIMIAHTLGNVFDLDAVTAFARKHDLWLIEDCCDALGSTWKGRHVGTFGDIATVSFYPAHHITMGEGGAVLTDKPNLQLLIESFRDWGRDCWCEPGKDNTCGKRFDWQLGTLPCGYDHKYTYSHIGYNLKATDMQAALGASQIDKLPHFIERRKENFRHLFKALQPLEDCLVLPEATPGSDPSWFGFPIGVREIGALQAAGPGSRSGSKEDRDPTCCSAETCCVSPHTKTASIRVIGDLQEHRLRHEQRLLDRRLPRLDQTDAELHGGCNSQCRLGGQSSEGLITGPSVMANETLRLRVQPTS